MSDKKTTKSDNKTVKVNESINKKHKPDTLEFVEPTKTAKIIKIANSYPPPSKTKNGGDKGNDEG